MYNNLDKTALKRSFLASLGRLIGVGLAAGAGSLMKQLIGNEIVGWGVALIMAFTSFVLIWFAEYEREKGNE